MVVLLESFQRRFLSKLLTERVGFGLWEENCSILFSREAGKYNSNRQNRCTKTCNFKPLSHHKMLKSNSRSLWDQFCTCWGQFLSGFLGSIDLLRGQSSSTQYDLALARPPTFISNNSWKFRRQTPASTVPTTPSCSERWALFIFVSLLLWASMAAFSSIMLRTSSSPSIEPLMWAFVFRSSVRSEQMISDGTDQNVYKRLLLLNLVVVVLINRSITHNSTIWTIIPVATATEVEQGIL